MNTCHQPHSRWTRHRTNLAQCAVGFLLGLLPALVVALHVWRVTA